MAAFAWLLGSVAFSALYIALTPRPQGAQPTRDEDLQVPNSKEGQGIVWAHGTVEVPGAVGGWWNLNLSPIRASGGKK